LATDAKQRGGNSPPGTVVVPRPRTTSPSAMPHNYTHPALGGSSAFAGIQGSARAPPLPQGGAYETYPHTDIADDEKRPMISSVSSSPDPESQRYTGSEGIVRRGSISTEQHYPTVKESGHYTQAYSAEPETDMSISPSHTPSVLTMSASNRPAMRGFSLVDDGPVATAQGVRQVQRGTRRTSQMPHSPASPVTGSSRSNNLPPGAAPPNLDHNTG
jgi:chitin synthase